MRHGLIATILFMFCATPAWAQHEHPEKHERLTHAVIAANILVNFGDVATTMFMRGRYDCDERGRSTTGRAICFKEANPLLRPFADNPSAFAVAKAAGAIAIVKGIERLHRTRPKTAIVAGVLAASLTGYVWHRNATLLKRHQ